MSTSKVPKTPTAFDIKSALLPLESVVIRLDDIDKVLTDLDVRFAKHPDFFDNDPVMIDLTQIPERETPATLDLPKLYQALKKYKMNPVALRSNNPTHHAWAELAGLFLITQSQMPTESKKSGAQTQINSQIEDLSQQSPLKDVVASTNAPDSGVAEAIAVSTCALIVDKPLRSGQHVYAKGRDLVVMAMVNPGAEIMADGHIHVYAPLRGKAIAGAKGNKDARIYTSCLEAELIAIAGVYRTSDTAIPKDVAGKPAQIRLVGDKLVMQPQ